jgi:hypothetical protein
VRGILLLTLLLLLLDLRLLPRGVARCHRRRRQRQGRLLLRYLRSGVMRSSLTRRPPRPFRLLLRRWSERGLLLPLLTERLLRELLLLLMNLRMQRRLLLR